MKIVTIVKLVLCMSVVLSPLASSTKLLFDCSKQTSCSSCVTTSTWTGSACRWCPVDNKCHAEGAILTNPCETWQNVLETKWCKNTATQRVCPSGALPTQGTRPGEDGCTYVPDAPAGPSFEQCCNQHDDCYQTCNALKSTCDANLGNCAAAVCEAFPFGTVDAKQQCLAWAGLYHAGVKEFASGAWRADQDAVCLC
eukprot:TRINITY_DN3130_c0_g1_i1.p1 TRINITY_DN3130_c0_g1~~TRINITY_DN3130_c0_g1_i1.p1  ORF type:complete len:197 (-),score=23.11 TRINITY_DN3130_c0_g1_i1:47-637(-)